MVKGSSSGEKRERAAKLFQKKELRSIKKNKKRKGKFDEEDYNKDVDGLSVTNAPTPAERRVAENGVNPLSQLYKKAKKEEKKALGKAHLEDHALGGHKITAESLPSPDFSELLPFRKTFWTGPAGEDPASDALKESRRSIGVNVKGELRQCPPPVTAVTAPGLPESFATTFERMKLATPSAVQMQCWPAILAGANVLALAPTGSGKTLAYGLPLVPHLQAALADRAPKVCVLKEVVVHVLFLFISAPSVF